MKLFFAGAEIPSHRKVLAELEAPHVALSYMGLRRRVKFAKPWLLEEKFPGEMEIFLDSGAYTVNKADATHTQGELREISDHYQSFVAQNLDRVTVVSEFDALALGRDWIEAQREDFYDDLPPEKFLPIWHPEWGLDYLAGLGEKYPRIGVPATSINGRNLAPVLNQLADSGSLLHGVAMTHVDEMSAIRWNSVSSTSWISPQQYGDTIVWTGRELKRYPKKYKVQARKRHRSLFEREGFDSEKIENDDSTELLRLSIWSWQQLMSDIERHQGSRAPQGATTPDDLHDNPFAEIEGDEVDTPTPETRNSVTTTEIARTRATKVLPVLGITPREETYTDEETGVEKTRTVSDVTLRSDSTRVCNTCYLASKCPAFEPGSNCAFDIPVKITTRDQFQKLQNSLIEMQSQRVMFMRYAEEQEGGYADPNLSSELDRLQKMLKAKHEIEQEGFTFKMEAKATGGGGSPGMIARLFGDQASEKARALPAPVAIEDVIDADSWEVR